MSTLAKLDKVSRDEAEERRRMAGVFLKKAQESRTDRLQMVYLAAHLALNGLCRDSTKTGAAKARVYKKILDEVTLNVAQINIAVSIEPRG